MRELSLHILDIVQNSIKAEASLIKIEITEDLNEDFLSIAINDNGSGIDERVLCKITDPFVTSRTTREVGLGLSLFKAAARRCGGDIEIKSSPGKGTSVKAVFVHSHLDRAPLGDIAGTVITIITTNPAIDIIYHHFFYRGNSSWEDFLFDTREIKKQLEDVSINKPQVLNWIEDYLREGLIDLRELFNPGGE